MDYKWTAHYDDGTELKQFEHDKEHLFTDIEQDKLQSFSIKSDSGEIIVDLTDGSFTINNNRLEIDGFSNLDNNYRLINFRRVRITFGTERVHEKTIEYFIGYQITINGKNHKVMVSTINDKISLHVK